MLPNWTLARHHPRRAVQRATTALVDSSLVALGSPSPATTTDGSAAAAVEVRDLRKAFGAGPAVLDGLSFSAARGRVTAVLGPNGAGKTTTVAICEGLQRADSGTVRVLGLDPVADAAACGRAWG